MSRYFDLSSNKTIKCLFEPINSTPFINALLKLHNTSKGDTQHFLSKAEKLFHVKTFHIGFMLEEKVWVSIHSFIFTPAFPLRSVAGAVGQGGLEIPLGQQQSLIVLLASHQDGTKKGRRCNHTTRSLVDLWAAFT